MLQLVVGLGGYSIRDRVGGRIDQAHDKLKAYRTWILTRLRGHASVSHLRSLGKLLTQLLIGIWVA